jgi:hypothetical protein
VGLKTSEKCQNGRFCTSLVHCSVDIDTSFPVSERRLSSEAYRNPVSSVLQSHAWSRYVASLLLDRRSSALTEKLVYRAKSYAMLPLDNPEKLRKVLDRERKLCYYIWYTKYNNFNFEVENVYHS